MFRSSNPTKEPTPLSTYLLFILYAFLAIVSIWASASSIMSHFGVSSSLGYCFGAAFAASSGMLLSLIQKSVSNRVIGSTILLGVLLLVTWGMSLVTNTHSFFMLSNLEDIQKQELKESRDELSLLNTNTASYYDRAMVEFENRVDTESAQLRNQITDPGQCGVGPKAQMIITKLGELLGTVLTEPQSPSRSIPCTSNRWARFADLYRLNVEELKMLKLQKLSDQKQSVIDVLSTTNTTTILKALDNHIDNYELFSREETEKTLELAFAEIARQSSVIQDQTELSEIDISSLPVVPESSELKRISALPKYLSASSGYKSGGLFWSLLFAIVIDLVAFVVLWNATSQLNESEY